MPNNIAEEIGEGAVPLTHKNIDTTLGKELYIHIYIMCNKCQTMLLNVVKHCIYFFLNYINFFTAENELVFINFYAQWCRFSNLLAPIFDKAADKIRAEFPEPGRVVMAKVDCDQESMFKVF